MSDLLIRNVKENDSALLRHLANNCFPLDVHTPYTYWVLCRFFCESCFVAYDEGVPVGFITSINADECVFVWQIGLLEHKRGKGYSSFLIDKVFEYARSKNKNLLVTIASDNNRSYNAFKSYCRKHSAEFKPTGVVEIKDLVDISFAESEIIYKMDIFKN